MAFERTPAGSSYIVFSDAGLEWAIETACVREIVREEDWKGRAPVDVAQLWGRDGTMGGEGARVLVVDPRGAARGRNAAGNGAEAPEPAGHTGGAPNPAGHTGGAPNPAGAVGVRVGRLVYRAVDAARIAPLPSFMKGSRSARIVSGIVFDAEGAPLIVLNPAGLTQV